MTRKIFALLMLFLLPASFIGFGQPIATADWAYFYSKAGMSDEFILAWSVGTGIMCSLSFTLAAGIGCGIAAAG